MGHFIKNKPTSGRHFQPEFCSKPDIAHFLTQNKPQNGRFFIIWIKNNPFEAPEQARKWVIFICALTHMVRPATWQYHLPGSGRVSFSVVGYPDRVLARKAGSFPNRTQSRTCCVLYFRITHPNDPAVASVNNGLIPSILVPLRPVRKWRPLVSRMAGTCCRTVLYLPCPWRNKKPVWLKDIQLKIRSWASDLYSQNHPMLPYHFIYGYTG